MNITYPTATIAVLRAQAASLGHNLDGRWRKSGLSYGQTCKRCSQYTLITAAWAPGEEHEIYGTATSLKCPGTKAVRYA